MATAPAPRRARRERATVAACAVLLLTAGIVSAFVADPVETDIIDLSVEPYEPARFPDRHVADAVASAMGDDAATERIIDALTPEAAAVIDASAFDEVQQVIDGKQLTVDGVLLRDGGQILTLVTGPDGPFGATVTFPAGQPERIDGLLLGLAPLTDDGPLSDVEMVLIAAAMLALVAAGLVGRSGRWCWAAGLVAGLGMLERSDLEPLQDLAVVALPLALAIAAAGVAGRRRPIWLAPLTAASAAASVLPVLSIDLGAGRRFGHLITVESLVGHTRTLQQVAAVVTLAAALAIGAWFGRGLAGADPRGLRWEFGGGVLASVAIAGVAIAGLAHPAPIDLTTSGWATAALVAIAAGRAAGLAQRHRDLTGIAATVADLGAGRSTDLATVLARALDDPSVIVLHARGDGFVDRNGRTATLPGDPARSTRLAVDGETVGAIVHDPAVADDPDRLRAACDAVKLSLANERLNAQIRWQLDEVRASRQRLVHAEERARQRIERDLHDGAQQRLTAANLALRMVQSQAASSAPEVAVRLGPIADELQLAADEIRELARGVRPAVLDGGLTAAADDLAERAAIPVTVESSLSHRINPEIETVAYFVISEALTNAARHAHAHHVTIALRADDGWLDVAVRDDGIGIGADVVAGERPSVGDDGGTGLVGLFDRVDAHGGTLAVATADGGGTLLHVRLPCER